MTWLGWIGWSLFVVTLVCLVLVLYRFARVVGGIVQVLFGRQPGRD